MRTLRVGLLVILVGGYACSGNSTEPSGTSNNPSNQPTNAVAIRDFSFNAATLRVSPGTQVRWTNQGQSDHTATSDAGLWDSGLISGNQTGGGGGGGGGGTYGGGAAGGSYSFTFVQVGEFAYRCSIHPQLMKGTIIVAE